MKLLLILVILNGHLADHALQTGDRFPCGNTDGVGDAIADDGRPGEVGPTILSSTLRISRRVAERFRESFPEGGGNFYTVRRMPRH